MHTNMSEIIALEDEINEVIFQTEQAIKDTEVLSKIEETLITKDDTLPESTLELTKVAVEAISTRLGINKTKLSLEANYTKELALEDIKTIIVDAWKAIKAAFNYILEKMLKIFTYSYDLVFGNNKAQETRLQKLRDNNPSITFTADADNSFIVHNENAGTAIAQELHGDPVRYRGPDPSLLIGEKINAISVGTSIVNFNKRLTSFLEDSGEILKNARHIILKEDIEGYFEEACCYLTENVPNLVQNHFGYSETEFLGKFRIQSRFYYNKKIRVVAFNIDSLELVKIEFDEMAQPKVDKTIKITIKDLEAAETMRQEVNVSLDKYIKDYEHDLKEMIRLLNDSCDFIIKKNLYTFHDVWYVKRNGKLVFIRDVLQYLMGFVSARILNAVKQSVTFDKDVKHLCNICHSAIQTKV